MFHGMDGGGFMWMGLIFWLILIIAVIWAISATIMKSKNSGGDVPSSETPFDILKKRYAKGEITKEQFEEMKKTIM